MHHSTGLFINGQATFFALHQAEKNIVKTFFSDFETEIVVFLTCEKVGILSNNGESFMSTDNGYTQQKTCEILLWINLWRLWKSFVFPQADPVNPISAPSITMQFLSNIH